MPLKSSTCVCSDHFVNSRGRKLRADEYPTLRLPKLLTSRTSPKKRKAPMTCSTNEGEQSFHVSECNVDGSILAISNTLEVLQPMDELLLVLMRLRLGLFEQDLSYHFVVSQSTVSRAWTAWVYFLYHKLKKLPIWMTKDVVQATLPNIFRRDYLTTCVIIDATKVYIEMPCRPEIQQLTFSHYKNHNTYKGFIGISPSGVVTFVSDLFPDSISNRDIVRRSGLLALLTSGDTIMADGGFDIANDLTPLGVRINIPPFLRGTQQFEPRELIITRRIASLRIHVERCME